MKTSILSILLFLILHLNVKACVCASQSVEERFNKYALIVLGEVISKTSISRSSLRDPKELEQAKQRYKEKLAKTFSDSVATIRYNWYLDALNKKSITKVEIVVLDFFKNQYQLPDTVTIYTSNRVYCSYSRFEIGETFIIYSSKSKNIVFKNPLNTFWTGLCSGTKYANKEELKNLQKLTRIKFRKSNLKTTINALLSKELLDSKKDTINVSILGYNYHPNSLGQIKWKDKIVFSSLKNRATDSDDLVITKVQISDDHDLDISFTSYDRDGKKYKGVLTMAHRRKRTSVKAISYEVESD